MDTAIIVPARLRSVRFPNKLLHKIHGKPLILWTAERLAQEVPNIPTYFAVEDQELKVVLNEAGYQAILTGADHQCGTDRIAEANQEIQAEHVLNVQADEPLIQGIQLKILNELIHGSVDMATLVFPFTNEDDFFNANCVKVALSKDGKALYFSRSPIPFPRGIESPLQKQWFQENACYHHIGVYAYRREFLEQFTQLPQGHLEKIEHLEQLRALENGFQIAVGITENPTIGVDTPEDADKLASILTQEGH
jgi:3-deoxy-manno-octulosonate cytidylyltransferase (CMP-KDO synthetase)